MSKLALHGGSPIRRGRAWPRWPQYDDATEQELLAALRSRRWAISWPSDGTKARERRFAEEFARYNGAPFSSVSITAQVPSSCRLRRLTSAQATK